MAEYGLDTMDIKNLEELFANFPCVDMVLLYGSRAKGCFKPFSDVDITLKGTGITYQELMNIRIAIDDLMLPFIFDVSVYDDLQNENLKSHIQRVGKVLYRKQVA